MKPTILGRIMPREYHVAKMGACVSAAIMLASCVTTPEEPVEPVVEVVEPAPEPEKPEPLPAIDIAEWERMQAEEAARLAAIEAANAPPPEPAPEPTPEPVVVVEKTLDEKLADAASPDAKIRLLRAARGDEAVDEADPRLVLAYQEKLAADRQSGRQDGVAEALVYLASLEARDDSREGRLGALKMFAEAQAADPSNAQAPERVSQLRRSLQSYADSLHERAVALFVRQDFASAVANWETVLLIDPSNSAARNWFDQARAALDR